MAKQSRTILKDGQVVKITVIFFYPGHSVQLKLHKFRAHFGVVEAYAQRHHLVCPFMLVLYYSIFMLKHACPTMPYTCT